MVRETRHLWVGNLPENIREDRIRDHFKRYGRVQSVKLLGGRGDKDEVCATVSFMDIKSAAKAHHSEQKLDERLLTTEYHEPPAIPTPNYSRFQLGSEELSSSFDRSSHFYDRGERGEGAGGYLRRSGYHSGGESLSRTRPRDRASYRNGPFTPIIESVVSRSGNSGSHHGNSGRSGGGGSWSYESPSPRYPPTTPDISYQEPAPILVHKKHSKSRHVNCRSGSDSGSNSSRSRSSSASSQSESSSCSTESSSPNSEKSCSAQSQQSTLRSSGVQSSGTANHTSSNSPAVHSEDRRPLAICVRNLPARSSDTSLKDGLYHEYKKHGKVTWVKVVGQGVDRYALVSFKKPEDVDKALQVSHDKLFFGCKIEVAPYQGYDVDDNEFRPFEAEQDEFHPKATRTLFIGNLDKDITTQEIRKHFDQFGEIIDIDIKKQGTSASYAFCQFSDIGSVVRAMRSLDGEHVGGNRVKLGFGKSMHTSCVWVDGVAESVSEKYLSQQFGQFGPVSHVVIDRARGQALVSYDQITYAQQAVKEMRGAVLRGRKLQVDYASRECQESFYDHMEKQTSSSSHPPPFENSHSVASSPQNLRVFETPSSSTTVPCAGSGSTVSSRYNNCSRYGNSRGGSGASNFGRSTSPSSRSSRHSISRFQEYPSTTSSTQDYEKRSSYRSYEDIAQVEETSAPTTGAGDIRHLQKERVSLLEQLEDCPSSGEEGTSRRRCNKHRRSASGEGSRPGTPLCDERPENLGPVEPRRPRESKPPETLSLPLPRFAAQVLSPRPAPPSPPASPQTHSSSSSDTEPSPEWEERLRSLDEKYEKWSGSRAGVTKVDPSTVKVRHKLLDLDLHELQPSEIVKSVLAKRSVFDEDSKRLENFGEKYEPREFVPARSSLLRGRIDLSPMSSPVMKSPSSPAAKGLQYPFPSHPPVQPTTSVATTTAPSVTTVTVATTEVKPSATTFLANCTTTRQFPLPKISSPQNDKCATDPRTPSTKVLPTSTIITKPIMSCKPIQESKKEPISIQTKVKTLMPLRRESCDDKKEDVRRKSRDESIENLDSIKRDDTSECDKVKDAQVTERRKSVCEKRSSSDIRDSCERTKDHSDKRRGSSETDSENKKVDKKLCDENHMDTLKVEGDKNKKLPSDCTERRKETETNIRHNIDLDKKKDVLGVNSEKDRRRNRDSIDLSDNPKYKKVPENKKELDVDKREDDMKIVDTDRKKESSESGTVQHLNRHKDKKDHQDRRRDSSEQNDKKVERISPENPEVHRIKERKTNHDLSEPRNSKKHHDESDAKCDTVKHKDSERRKNSENEISKEHSLFKKVFGFAERTYGHHKDRRDSDSTAVKTDETIKHKRDHSDKDRKKDKESDHSESSSKHRSRKSPDQPENNRHKERKHSESSEKRSRKEYEQSDDYKQKDDHSDSFHNKTRDRKEERSKDNSKNIFSVDQECLPILGKHRENDRRKETLLDETRISEADSNDLKLKDGECKKENEVFFDRRKDDNSESRNKDERRKDSEKYFDNEKYNNDRIKKEDSGDLFKDLERKSDMSSDFLKYKHDRQRDNDRKREVIVENCRPKDLKDDHRHDLGKHKDDRKTEDLFESLKSKDDNFRFREYARKKDNDVQEHIRIKDIIDSKKKEEKEKKKERDAQDISFKKSRDSEDKNRDMEKSKRKKEFEMIETKINGDHDDYLDNIECRKPNYEEELRIDPIKKDKKKERNNTWPAPIGCKRRLSSQDSLEIVEDAKRSKPERRDSKDSGRSSGSSRKGGSDKHKGYTKLLEEKIKEDKEHEQRKKDDLLLESSEKNDEKILKPAIRKEKRNSGEKRKEERKYKNRPRENGTASESDLGSGDEETKSNKRQHSIFDIVVDEPAYISMYDKVKARSTKNMQKQEEEKRQEKLKEKFHQLKASRAKREEKKRSTSFDEDSDSEKGCRWRSIKILLTSSDEDGCSESDIRIRSRKVLCDTSEDDNDTMSVSRTANKYSDYDSKSSRKIISDISEDDTVIKPSTPKLKPSRNISFESELKTRKIMSDKSEDENTRHIPRQKPSRIQSDESEGDLGFEDSIRNEAVRVKASFHEPAVKIVDVFAIRPVEMNHFTGNDHGQKQHPLQSSPESIRRISFDSATSEQPRKKSHKKKQKKKNYEVSEDGTIIIRKHSSKKEKKKSHRDNDEEDKKSRKKKSERESSSNKKEEKLEDIFGPLSDDSEKTGLSKWQVPQVYGSDSESERENIRKKEKKRKEKKNRELDEAGRAIEAKLLDTSEDITEEPIKVKKKKRKKSRDEKIKHHRIAGEESVPSIISKGNDSTSETNQVRPDVDKNSDMIKIDIDNEREDEKKHKIDIEYGEQACKEENLPVIRPHSSSLSSLLDSPPAQPVQHKKPDIPGFGSEVDENIHETAVKSISETNHEEQPPQTQEKYNEKSKPEEPAPTEDKPTPVISQEETEDAVAALLMEDTFCSGFERYSEDTPKPDTPVSEPDLQIDTDTEDNFDPPEFKTPREPDVNPPFYQQNNAREGLEERIMPLACSAEPSISKQPEKSADVIPFTVPKEETLPTCEVPETFEESETSLKEEDIPKEEETPLLCEKVECKEIEVPAVVKEEILDVKMDIDLPHKNSKSITDITETSTDKTPNSFNTNKSISSPTAVETMSSVKEEPEDSNAEDETILNEAKRIKLEPEHIDHTDDCDSLTKSEVQKVIKQEDELPDNQSETKSNQQNNVKPQISETNTVVPPPPAVLSNVMKPDLVQHQVGTMSHSTVLVHQTLQQPPPAQVVKPLAIQVINPPALKPLDQPINSKANTSPVVGIKLNSPPDVLATTTQAPSKQKPQQASQGAIPKSPLHHIPPFQEFRKLSNPSTPLVSSHLVPSHLPIKPATQISLQTPQLTPISKGSPVPTTRPLVVHTIQQNHSSQKQLHIVPVATQLPPQPISPQNLKVIRPVQNQPTIIRSPTSPQSIACRPSHPTNSPVPLLQTVCATESPVNKQVSVRPSVHLTNAHILHSVNQAPQPEKIVNLTPNQQLHNVPVVLTQKLSPVIAKKTEVNKPAYPHENNVDVQDIDKKVVITQDNVSQKSIPSQSIGPSLVKPIIQINSVDETPKDSPNISKKENEEFCQTNHSGFEQKHTKPAFDEAKPLNAVIQDLTIRAANKALCGKISNLSNIPEIKPESPKPIEQVVREIQQRKHASSLPLPSETDKAGSQLSEINSKEEVTDANNIKEEPVIKKEKEDIEDSCDSSSLAPLVFNKESNKIKEEEEVKEVVKPLEDVKAVEELTCSKEKKIVDNEHVQEISLSSDKCEPKNSPEPEPQTPKSHKDSEPDVPSSEERVTPEKSTPVITSARGRGGRTRGKRGRGSGGVITRRGGRHASTTVSHTTPTRPQAPADVYEFRDDSEEERPRLILTIKPEQPLQQSNNQVPSTRKSRRLQEKDGSRTTVDDTIEDVIRHTGRPGRRATRSTAPLLSVPTTVESTRKSPRRKQPAQSQPISHERSPTPTPCPLPSSSQLSASPQPSNSPAPQSIQSPSQPQQQEPPQAPQVVPQSPQAVPQSHTTALSTQKVPQIQPQKEQQLPQQQEKIVLPEREDLQQIKPIHQKEIQAPQRELQVQRREQQTSQVQHQLQQKQHVPSKQIVQSQTTVKLPPKLQTSVLNKNDLKPLIPQRPHGIAGEPTNLIDPVTGLLIPMREEEGQYIPVGGDGGDQPPEKRPRLDDGVGKTPVTAVRPSVVRPPQQLPYSVPKPGSPPHLPQRPVVNSTVPRPPKAHLLQAVAAESVKIVPQTRPKLVPPPTLPIQAPKPPTPLTPKAHILQSIGNAQAREGIIGSPAPHQGSILTGSVASPPLRTHPQPIVTGASSSRFVIKGHSDIFGGRVGPDSGCIVVPSPSPQAPPRGQVMQAGLPVPAYEASLGEVIYQGHTTDQFIHHQQYMLCNQYLRDPPIGGSSPYHRATGGNGKEEPVARGSPPLELRRRASPHDRTTDSPQVATLYGQRAHLYPPPPVAHRPVSSTRHQVTTPPHASQVPPQGDSLLVLLERHPVLWQGLLALKNDQAAVQMHYIFGNPNVARDSLPLNNDGSTPPLRIAQRMRLEQTQLDGVSRKMQMDHEHCMLLALPCGRDHLDVLQQSYNLRSGFITYLQQKQAAGIVNIPAPGSQRIAAYVVHIFPASEFANESLARIAPHLMHRVSDVAHLLIVIATV